MDSVVYFRRYTLKAHKLCELVRTELRGRRGRRRGDKEWQRRTKDKKFSISGCGCVAPEAGG